MRRSDVRCYAPDHDPLGHVSSDLPTRLSPRSACGSKMMNSFRTISIAAVLLAAVATLNGQQASTQNQDSFRFKSGVELINVTATVSDSNGRFVPGLTKDDFIVYEDDVRQTVSQFSPERVPVSLGIV